jgi:hypothetical protein
VKLNEVFPSNYVKADDLKGREVSVVISEAKMEKLGSDTKLVIYFQNKDKGMVCNKTNANRIAYLYGEDTDDWIGKEIVLASEFVEYQGKTVKGLRVRPPAPAAASKQQSRVVTEQRAGYSVSTTTHPKDGLEEILDEANMEREPF